MRPPAAAFAALLWIACGPSGGEGSAERAPHERGGDEVGGDTVATVDGHGIDRSLVASAARAAEVTPEVALSRLEDEQLLALAAARAGLEQDPEVRRASRRALVQSLLARTVETAAIEPSPEQVEQAFEAGRERFSAPERRRSTRVLAEVPPGAEGAQARAWIERVILELSQASDATNAALAIRRRQLDQLPFSVEVSEIGALARQEGWDPAYQAGLFSREEPGVVPEPIRTARGFEAIVITWIEPARSISREQALHILEGERDAALRQALLQRFVQRLRTQRPTAVSPEATRWLSELRLGPQDRPRR